MLPAALFLLLLGCGHDLRDGTYLFQREELLRETCTLDPPLPDRWEGSVQVRGATVSIRFDDPAFHATSAQAVLVGRFDPNRNRETFRVNSSSEVETGVDGLSCLVYSQLQLVATAQEDGSFDGTLTLTYSRQVVSEAGCPFSCVVEQQIHAVPSDG